MIAALYVAKNGCYYGIEDVDPWPQERDARLYPGPHPVVAHPPCARWCRLAGLVEARYGYKRGEDDGVFAAALDAVRTYGGVLEHPAYSKAWTAFQLPLPPAAGWQRGICAGWACHVEQGRYGHPAKKATWLYAYGASRLPTFDWTRTPDSVATAIVSFCGNHRKWGRKLPRLRTKEASATPEEFRDALLDIARSCPMRPRTALI